MHVVELLGDSFPSWVSGLGGEPGCIMGVEVSHDVAIGEGVQVLKLKFVQLWCVGNGCGRLRGDVYVDEVDVLFVDSELGGLYFQSPSWIWRECGNGLGSGVGEGDILVDECDEATAPTPGAVLTDCGVVREFWGVVPVLEFGFLDESGMDVVRGE